MLLAPHGLLKLQPYRRNAFGDDTVAAYEWKGIVVQASDAPFIPIWPYRYGAIVAQQVVYFPKMIVDCTGGAGWTALKASLADLIASKHLQAVQVASAPSGQPLEGVYPWNGNTQSVAYTVPTHAGSATVNEAETRYEAGQNFYLLAVDGVGDYSFLDPGPPLVGVETGVLNFDVGQAQLMAAQHYSIGGLVFAGRQTPDVASANAAIDTVAASMASAVSGQVTIWDRTNDPTLADMSVAEAAIRSFFA